MKIFAAPGGDCAKSTSQSASPLIYGPLRRGWHDPYGLLALAIYLVLSFVFVGRALTQGLSAYYIGRSNDPSAYMWFLKWWPYAIAHRLNPIITPMVWAPAGFNLAWTPGMPLVAIVAAPLTNALGPVVSYNLLCLLAPAVAAWSCFLLCRRIAGSWWIGMVGGYIFGFSAYALAETRGHLQVVLVFPLPLLLLFTLDLMDGRIGGRRFSLIAGAVLVVVVLCWAELYATLTMFGAIAFILALAFGERNTRVRLRELLIPIAGAYGISASAVLPYLYYFLQPGYPRTPINSPEAYSADLLNLVIPTPINALGMLGPVQSISSRFPGNSLEASAYIGLPLIAIAVWFAWARWRQSGTRLLCTFLAIVCLLMLGTRLHVGGFEGFGMPWKLASRLPLLKHALPVRFSIYGFLAVAIIAAIWLSEPRPTGFKIAALVLIAISFCPNPSARFWTSRNNTPEFFTRGDYRQYLQAGENVILLPYGGSGNSMLWQSVSGFYYRMAGGWFGITPREFERWPIVRALLTQTYIPDAPAQLLAFMSTHQVQTVVSDERASVFWAPILTRLDPSPVHAGGVAIYQAAAGALNVYRSTSALAMERNDDEAKFAALLSAAHSFVEESRDLNQLTPMRAQQFGLLPAGWVRDRDVRTNNGLYLGPWSGNRVALGVVGSYEALRPLITRYSGNAAEVFFPFPKPLKLPPAGDTFMRLLVMVFDQQFLASEVHQPNH